MSRILRGRARAGARMLLVTGVALAATAGAASAALNEPPAFPKEVIVFSERDMLALAGLEPNTMYHARVVREGFVVGTSQGTTDSAGLLEINHPGGSCWNDSTPNIVPEDRIEISTDAAFDSVSNDVDAWVTRNVVVDAGGAVRNDGSRSVVMTGTAQLPSGAPIPLDQLEARIIQPSLVSTVIARRDLRAPGAGRNGEYLATLAYDAPGSTHWTATFTFGSQAIYDQVAQLVVEGQDRALSWMDADGAGNRFGITIFEEGEVGGPGMPECPAAGSWAVTSSNPAVVNTATIAGADLVLSGVSMDASEVSVTLDDEDPATPAVSAGPAVPSPASGSQTWSVQVPMSVVAGLDDGMLTASGTYTVTDPSTLLPVQIGGQVKTIVKDTVRPAVPTATPGEGSYLDPVAVTLETDSIDNRIRFTANGSTPGLASGTLYTQQVQVSVSQTVKAVAIDPAGNTSDIAATCPTAAPCAGWFRYVIGALPAPTVTAPVMQFVANTVVTAGGAVPTRISWSAGGTPVQSYQLQQSRNGGAFVNVALPTPTTSGVTRSLTAGTYVFRVSATGTGGGSVSAFSTAPAVAVALGQQTSPTVTYVGAWTNQAMAGASGGSVRFAAAATARATYAFSGRGISWISTKGPNRGRAEVRVDGILRGTVDLFAATQQARRVVFALDGLTAGPHTIEIRPLGTRNPSSRGNRVDVDAFGSMS